MRTIQRALAAAVATALLPAAACNLIFGIHDGEPTSSSSGVGGCGVYMGGGMFTATNAGSANIPTVDFDATGSISGSYDASHDVTMFNIGGGSAGGVCDIGFQLGLSGHVAAGKTYTLVSRATSISPAFDMGAPHAFVDLLADLDCTPPTPKEWQSLDGAAGTVTIITVTATSVTVKLAGVVVTGVSNAMATGTGTLTLDGSGRADCFGF